MTHMVIELEQCITAIRIVNDMNHPLSYGCVCGSQVLF